MKNLLILLTLSLLAISCGQNKGGVSKANFKIISGNLIDTQAVFPGGMLLMGRSIDDSQSFIVAYTPDLSLDLKKGAWEFATIGWMSNVAIEGNQQCDYLKADILSDTFSVTFNMTYSKCMIASSVQGNRFSAPYLYNHLAGAYNGFKKLNVRNCPNLVTTCSSVNLTSPVSFIVEIPPEIRGINSTAGIRGLKTNCINSANSNVTPPLGGSMGFIGMKIITFSGSSCAGTARSYFFRHGFGERLNETFVDASGVTQYRNAALSIDPAPVDSTLALSNFKFMGEWSSTSSLPTPAGVELYKFTANTTSSFSPTASPDDFLHYNGSTWISVPDAASVALILEDY
ncbi:MAG: hypothetical protein WC635_12965 [Bacteriovorax sp.]|jgi:hypothetical protein